MVRDGIQQGPGLRQVVVVGGGLAGISAACNLAGQGVRVTLLEKRPYLGGKVYSFADGEVGEVDNGQHVFLRCCTAYTAFLKKLGVLERTTLQPSLSIPVIGKDGRRSFLTRAPLPPPFHLGPSLAGYRHLSMLEKLWALRVTLAMKGMRYGELRRLEGVDFGTWLKEQGQSERAIGHLWDLIILPALNDVSSQVSAAQAIVVFQEAFLDDPAAADIGLANVSLSSLCYQEATNYIEARGGRVVVGANVQSLVGGIQGIDAVRTHEGEFFSAEAYVMGLPPRELFDILPEGLVSDPFFGPARNLKPSPIVNVHLWFDAPVTDLPFAAYLDSHVQWVFAKLEGRDTSSNSPLDRGRAAKAPAGRGQHIAISLSGAHRYIDMPKDELLSLMLADLQKVLPAARKAHVLQSVIVRERDATFTPEPGSASWRLPARTPVPNLFLAGAWTDTGWPATMESAVRSGDLAAREVVQHRWTTR